VTSPAEPWHRRPLPSLAVGLTLLGVTAVCAYLWLSDTAEGARLVGSVAGVGGIVFSYGGLMGLSQARSSGRSEW